MQLSLLERVVLKRRSFPKVGPQEAERAHGNPDLGSGQGGRAVAVEGDGGFVAGVRADDPDAVHGRYGTRCSRRKF